MDEKEAIERAKLALKSKSNANSHILSAYIKHLEQSKSDLADTVQELFDSGFEFAGEDVYVWSQHDDEPVREGMRIAALKLKRLLEEDRG